MDDCELLVKTRQLLEETDTPLAKIAQDTGLSYYWLNQMKYAAKKVDPSVTKTVKLYEYLSGKTLKVD